MKKLILPIALAIATPAMAEGFNLTELMRADFKVVGVVSGNGGEPKTGPSRRFDTLYLQGKLPGNSMPIVVRCVVRADAEEGESNCWQVY